jgi:hypothetical protein
MRNNVYHAQRIYVTVVPRVPSGSLSMVDREKTLHSK